MAATRRTSRATARKGSLRWKKHSAREVKASDPTFGRLKGRIAVDRDTGVLEFPSAQQFQRIAREEGIDSTDVDRAFGHLLPKKKRTSRPKKKRASRKRVRKNAKRRRIVRRDLLQAPETLRGDPIDFTARTYQVDPADVERLGFRYGVMLDIGGKVRFYAPEDAMRRSYRWFSGDAFKKAFGHLMGGSVLGEKPPARRIPTTYGPRTMRLGHWTALELDKRGKPHASPSARPVAGGARGQLILFYKPKRQVVLQFLHDTTNDNKPIVVKLGAKSKNVSWGRGLALAQEHNIPPLAYLDAFGYMLSAKDRRELYQMFVAR